jgi:hypothetical protein
VNATEAKALLAVARVLDPRICPADAPEPDPFLISLWADLLSDVSYKAAEAALREHYKHSTEKIMPGHIRPLMAKIMDRWRQAQDRQSKEVSWEQQRQSPQPAITVLPPSAPAPKRVESDRDRKAKRDEDLFQWRAERAARSPEAAAAWEFMKSRVSQSPVGKKPWWQTYADDSPLQRDRASKGDPERLGPMLRLVQGEIAKGAEDAA